MSRTMNKLWSCEFKLAECRNPFGCHCREIIALHHQVKTLEKAHAPLSMPGVAALDAIILALIEQPSRDET